MGQTDSNGKYMLTDAAIRQAVKNGRNVTLKDGQGRGTGRLVVMVRAMPGRTIAEYYAQQWLNGRRRTTKIGNYPQLTLAQARGWFMDNVSGLIQTRQNIKTTRAIKPGTVEDLFNGYVAHLEKEGKACVPDARRGLERVLEHVEPTTPANEVKTADIVAAIRPVYERGKKSMADHLRAYVSAAFGWGLSSESDYRNGLIEKRFNLDRNPAAPIPAEAKKPGTRWLSPEELRDFLDWCSTPPSKYDLQNHITPTNLAVLQLIAMTGQRVEEIARIHSDYYNKSAGLLDWPETKNGRAHVLPLPKQAIQILDSLTPNKHGLYFPSIKRPNEPVTHGVLYCIVRKYIERERAIKFTPRDLRRTWKTLSGYAGIPKEIRDRLQNHARSDVSSKHYDRYEYLDEKRRGMRVWEVWLGENVLRLKIKRGA
jgi:integrase